MIDSPNRLVTARYGWSHPEHTIELTPEEIASLVHAAGFDVRTVRGLWRCIAPDGSLLPFDTDDTHAQLLRTQTAADDPDACFLWWLEAERAAREPDLGAVRRQLHEITPSPGQRRATDSVMRSANLRSAKASRGFASRPA